MEDIFNLSVKVKNLKCIGDDEQGFDQIKGRIRAFLRCRPDTRQRYAADHDHGAQETYGSELRLLIA